MNRYTPPYLFSSSFLFDFGVFCLTIYICTIRRVDGVVFPLNSSSSAACTLYPGFAMLFISRFQRVIFCPAIFVFSTIIMHRGITAYLVLSCDHVGG